MPTAPPGARHSRETDIEPQGTGEAPSGLSVRDLAPMKGDPCAVLRDRALGRAFLGTVRRAAFLRALADPVGLCCLVPSGRTDRGLKDGAGILSRKRLIRMASEERALAVRSGAHPGPDAGAAGRLV